MYKKCFRYARIIIIICITQKGFRGMCRFQNKKKNVGRRLANRVRPVSRQIQQQRLNIFVFFVRAHNIIIILPIIECALGNFIAAADIDLTIIIYYTLSPTPIPHRRWYCVIQITRGPLAGLLIEYFTILYYNRKSLSFLL